MEDGDIRPSLITAVIPGSVAVTVVEQPIEHSGSDLSGCIPLRISHARFGVLRPHVREPPARELIEGFVGKERSILRWHPKASYRVERFGPAAICSRGRGTPDLTS